MDDGFLWKVRIVGTPCLAGMVYGMPEWWVGPVSHNEFHDPRFFGGCKPPTPGSKPWGKKREDTTD